MPSLTFAMSTATRHIAQTSSYVIPGQPSLETCELQVYLFSAFWFWPSPGRQLPSPDLESDQPAVQRQTDDPAAVQRPNQRPWWHPVSTKPTTLPTTSLLPTTRTRLTIDHPTVDHLSSTDLHITRSMNLHPFSCYTVALRLSLHCLGSSH